MHPIYPIIALCRKLVALFRLAQQMLTQQQHYDWGLRALKTCLALAGKLLNESRSAAPGKQVADIVQTQLTVRSVWLVTMPKLTFDDTSRQVSISYNSKHDCVSLC